MVKRGKRLDKRKVGPVGWKSVLLVLFIAISIFTVIKISLKNPSGYVITGDPSPNPPTVGNVVMFLAPTNLLFNNGFESWTSSGGWGGGSSLDDWSCGSGYTKYSADWFTGNFSLFYTAPSTSSSCTLLFGIAANPSWSFNFSGMFKGPQQLGNTLLEVVPYDAQGVQIGSQNNVFTGKAGPVWKQLSGVRSGLPQNTASVKPKFTSDAQAGGKAIADEMRLTRMNGNTEANDIQCNATGLQDQDKDEVLPVYKYSIDGAPIAEMQHGFDVNSFTVTDISGNGHDGMFTASLTSNTVANSGFEVADSNNAPLMWSLGSKHFRMNETIYSGNWSLKINATTSSATTQVISVQPNTLYRLSGWFYNELNNGRAYLDLNNGQAVQGAIFGECEAFSTNGYAQWEQVSCYFMTSNTLQITVRVVVDGTLQGRVYVDDLRVEDMPYTSNGVYGGAFAFDGAGDYAAVPDSSVLDVLQGQSMTFTAWIKTSSNSGYQTILSKKDYPAVDYYLLGLENGKPGFTVTNNAFNAVYSVNSSKNIADGKWHHVAAVRDASAGKIKMYVDGVLVATGTDNVNDYNPGDNQEPLLIGAENNCVAGGSGKLCTQKNFFSGSVDELRFYRRVLSSDQILLESRRSYQSLALSETSLGQQVVCTVIPTDGWQYGQSKQGTFTYIGNQPPVQNAPLIKSASGLDLDADDLSCVAQGVSDPNGDAVTTTYSFFTTQQGPIASLYLPFIAHNLSAKQAIDVSGYQHLVAAYNVTFLPNGGKVGGAYQFNGNGVLMASSVLGELDLAVGKGFSIEAWVNTDKPQWTMVVAGKAPVPPTSSYYFLLVNMSKPQFIIANAAQNGSSGSSNLQHTVVDGKNVNVADGKWHHLVGVRDPAAGKAYLYVDGVKVATTNDDASIPVVKNTNFFAVGEHYQPWGVMRQFYGKIDEVAVYQRALSSREILMHNNTKYDKAANEETYVGEKWGCTTYISDGVNIGVPKTSNVLQIKGPNMPPSVTAALLNASSPLNLTNDTLSCSAIGISDPENDPVRAVFSFNVNGQPYAALYIPFEGGTINNTFAKDFSGNGKQGIVVNGVYKSNGGKIGSAYQFNGNGAITVVDYDAIDLQKNRGLTLEAWIQTTKTSGIQTIIGKANWPAYDFYFLRVNGTKAEFYLTNDIGQRRDAVRSVKSVADGQWHHVAAVRDPGTQKIYMYVDGFLEASAGDDASLNVADNQLPLGIGAFVTYSGIYDMFNGLLDEVAVYPRALGASEIREHYLLRPFKIVDNETNSGETWQCSVTVADWYSVGNTVNSNSLLIYANVTTPNGTNGTNGSGGGPGGGGGGGSVYTLDFSQQDSFSLELYEDDDVYIKKLISNKLYRADVEKVYTDKIKMHFIPGGDTVTIEEGSSEDVNLDQIGGDDLTLTILDIDDNVATVEFVRIGVSAPPSGPSGLGPGPGICGDGICSGGEDSSICSIDCGGQMPPFEPPSEPPILGEDESEGGSKLMWWIIGTLALVILVGALVAVFIIMKKKKEGEDVQY